ncbi:hypothetical protein [Flavobacterium sp. NRK1]|uniref:hypothetical protein n=1 Tax=Flavobacterium sp. NRK1 TaxID=2954929 RepID=UPI002092445F|nr:hypothetical protein [Flavobacterium sp. NRK1]MCO6149596.1 hypothetical protein [Flavobacterium sp. NRK1]
MYNLHYNIYSLPHRNIHKTGWYSFCLINNKDNSSLLLLDPSSGEIPEDLDNGIVISVKEDQLPQQIRDSLKNYPLFYQSGHGPFPLTAFERFDISNLFEKIASQINSGYIYKDFLLANLSLQIIHFGIKHFSDTKVL